MESRSHRIDIWRLAVVLTLSMAFAMAAFIYSGTSSAGEERQDAAATDDIPLHDRMHDVQDRLRAVTGMLRSGDVKTAEALEHLTKIQQHIVAAKQMPAPHAEDQPEGSREAYRLGFRKALAELLGELTKLEIDLIENRHEDASTRIRGTIIEMRNAAHEVYQVD